MTEHQIQYVYKTSYRARNIKISVSPGATVTVVSPPFIPRFFIDGFVSKSKSWIDAQLKKITLLPEKETFISSKQVVLFGKTYIRKQIFTSDMPIGIHIKASELIINQLAPDQKQKTSDTQLERFIKQTAHHYITKRTHELALKMDSTFGSITLRQQKTRWGSCSSVGNLNFNWRLVHFAPAIIDYVIVHELAHRTHMNHSKAFWHLVGQFDSEYHKHRGYLQRHSMMVG